VEQPPGHGADAVEEVAGGVGLLRTDATGDGKQLEVGIDLFR
jgi:hypothetical protein